MLRVQAAEGAVVAAGLTAQLEREGLQPLQTTVGSNALRPSAVVTVCIAVYLLERQRRSGSSQGDNRGFSYRCRAE
jgi:preprotein translocase subunit Sec61beta